MAISKQDFSNYIKQFKLKEMFNDMGWDQDRTSHPIAVDTTTYQLNAIAQKSGFKILICNPLVNGNIPNYSSRKIIETKITKLFQEHLLIFTDAKKQEQIWQLVIRQPGKPTKVTETRYHISQDPELLYQRAAGLFFELDEEEHITIIDVTKRVSDNFNQNNERVTKQFYDRFKQQHTAFLKFIKGIEDKVNQDWYASLMLNRLMFCYFIQKKGFLDSNKNYLRDKLKECQEKKGKDKFYSFYRSFLLRLFHHGLGAPDHNEVLKAEIGNIPYLNGGLFDEHELEISHNKIEIDDKAFESIFKFFDEWEWHLDIRHTASGKDINPDVIGYIFEKYINDRADMGAYYTKEDITDYISKNCIIPFLFDKAARLLKIPSEKLEIAEQVKDTGDRYIYDSVKRGVEDNLPYEIAAGINDVGKRTEWNKPATQNFALPMEIWREVIDRRNRYAEIKNKIQSGEVTSINDFITYNLNIRQFAIDSIANTNNPEFLKVFYKSLNSITIIDPTCGSGAFLFAAMNILEELYEECIRRMQNFLSEAPKGKYKFFEEIITKVTAPEHPNLQYFIFKNIILHNIYGVDIMKEAVEIAKLRLFLKLVATVEANYSKQNLGLEPLPDIDFNIRSGNTLVGFATEAELKNGLAYTLDGLIAQPLIELKCAVVAKAFARYKEIQLTYGDDYKTFKKVKDELQIRLKELNYELNLLLHKQAESLKFAKWLESYKPFHWFAEFYEIVHVGKGFDIVIGNPPYVEYSEVKKSYVLKNYKTIETGNLYSFCIERFTKIARQQYAFLGVIVPISSVSTPRMKPLMEFIVSNSERLFTSNFAVRPGKLFSGVDMNLTILISAIDTVNKNNCMILSTKYNRWNENYRGNLFETLSYSKSELLLQQCSIPKLGSSIESSIYSKFKPLKMLASKRQTFHSADTVYYHSGGRYWRKCIKSKISNEYKELNLIKGWGDAVVSTIASSLYYWYWILLSDCYHVTKNDIDYFPIPDSLISDSQIPKLTHRLLKDLDDNKEVRVRNRKDGTVTKEINYYVGRSKPIIDEIDTVLAAHYGFSEEELDFIINYDIKYRMGKDLESEEE